MTENSEQQLITDYLKDKLVEGGWQYRAGAQLERDGVDEPLLLGNLRAALRRINADLNITDKEIDDVIQEIKLVPTGETGAKQILHYLKYGVGVKFYADKIVKIVNLFDFANPANNDFIVAREVSFRGSELARADIVLYVNGIPLVNIEGKNPLSLSVSWQDAYRQIKRYERVAGEAYKYIQIGAVADVSARYFAIVPWQSEVGTYEWKESGLDAVDALAEFLRPERVLDILRNFLFVREERGSHTKVIARYMQYRAVNKICARVQDNLGGADERNKGLVWHWQGSGKTLTMIFAAHKLYFEKKLEAPSIFFIIDRRELEEQMSAELSGLDLNFGHDKIKNVDEMKDIIKADNYRGRRGVFVTLLHKFRPNETMLPSDFGGGENTIADRKNVICFLDEVHRSQYGLLAAQMKRVFRSAFYFGFTGTPVDEKERDTYREFGYPVDSEDYLDKYFINESLTDGFTVPVVFAPRQEKLHYSAEVLKAIDAAESENPFGYEDTEDKIARKLYIRDAFLENKKRIVKVSADIAAHFREYVDGRFKAMVVCGSRLACILYKQKLDALLSADASEVVMTFNVGDRSEIADYYTAWKAKYPAARDDKEIRDEIVRRFKASADGNPKILVVTDMLLTGFDAPILQTMYFDKPLKKHRLLQAIARVNRLLGEVKKAGVIVDYAGILKEAKRAHEMYYEDAQGTTVPFEYGYLLKNFRELMKDLRAILGATPKNLDRPALIAVIDRLRDEAAEKKFLQYYAEARKYFELLGSDEIKLDYLADYKFYSAVFAYLQKLKGEEGGSVDEKYFSKTIDAVQSAIDVESIRQDLPPFTFDVAYFDAIARSPLNKKEQAMNNLFALERMVLVEQFGNPIFRSVYDKVAELVYRWREKAVDYEELYDKEVKIIGEIKQNKKEMKELDLNGYEFGVYDVLRARIKKKEKSQDLARSIYSAVQEHIDIPNWYSHAVLRQNMARAVREKVRTLKATDRLSLDVIDELSQIIFNSIEQYAQKGGKV